MIQYPGILVALFGAREAIQNLVPTIGLVCECRVAITGAKGLNGAEQVKEEAKEIQEQELSAVVEVKIDNHSEPFATIVTVEYGDKLGELLDTVAALKALGLNIKRAKLGADNRHKFYITDAGQSGGRHAIGFGQSSICCSMFQSLKPIYE